MRETSRKLKSETEHLLYTLVFSTFSLKKGVFRLQN